MFDRELAMRYSTIRSLQKTSDRENLLRGAYPSCQCISPRFSNRHTPYIRIYYEFELQSVLLENDKNSNSFKFKMYRWFDLGHESLIYHMDLK